MSPTCRPTRHCRLKIADTDIRHAQLRLLGDLEELRRPRARVANPLVARVWEQASVSMGVESKGNDVRRNDAQLEKDTDFVSNILRED